MKIYTESREFREICDLIEGTSCEDHICVDLIVEQFLDDNRMIHREEPTGDYFVEAADLQYAADTFCATELDILNY